MVNRVPAKLIEASTPIQAFLASSGGQEAINSLNWIRDEAFYQADYPNLTAAWNAMAAAGGGRLVLSQDETLTAPLTGSEFSFAIVNASSIAGPKITIDHAGDGITWSSTRTDYEAHKVVISGLNLRAGQNANYGVNLQWPGGPQNGAFQFAVIKDMDCSPAGAFTGVGKHFLAM